MFFAYFRQFLGSGAAIALGVALAAAVSVVASTVGASVRAYDYQNNDKYDLIAEKISGSSNPRAQNAIKDVPGVESASTRRVATGKIKTNDLFLEVPVATLPGVRSELSVLEGRLPVRPREIALTPEHTALFQASVGQQVNLILPARQKPGQLQATTGQSGQPTSANQLTSTVTVTGLVDKYHPMQVRGDTAILIGNFSPQVQVNHEKTTKIVLSPGTDQSSVRLAIQESLGPTYLVNSGIDWAESQRTYAKQAQAITTVILGVFAVICLVVMGMVVGNGFLITLARRSQELALQRCLGSTRGQIIGQVMFQTFVLSILFAALGALLGSVPTLQILTWVNRGYPDLPLILPTIQPWNVLAAATAGVALACASAWMPAVKASLGSPVKAMEPPTPISEQKTVTGWTFVYGLSAFATGAGLLMWAPIFEGIWPVRAIIILCGAIATYFGWTVCNVAIVPALLRAWGLVLTRILGFPGEMAVRNTVRNTGRAVAMISTLMVGVVLTVAVSCVGAVALASIDTQGEKQEGPNLRLTVSPETPLTDELENALRQTRGVQDVKTSKGFVVKLLQATEQRVPLDAAAARENTTPRNRPRITGIELTPDLLKQYTQAATKTEPGVVVVNLQTAATLKLTEGTPVSFEVAGQQKTFTVAISRAAISQDPILRPVWDAVYFHPSDITELRPTQVSFEAFITFIPGASTELISQSVSHTVSNLTDVNVDTAYLDLEEVAQPLRYIRWITLALLALAIFIAIVGMASTISLAVAERKLESALLRALGVTTGQIRTMYTTETLIFALASTTAGTLLGLWYGWAGSRMLAVSAPDLFDAKYIQLSMVPWGQTALINALILVVSLTLTLFPVWRAGRVAPAEGLSAG